MKFTKPLVLSFLLFSLTFASSSPLSAQSDSVQYLFMGHPRFDDRDHEYVLKTVEKLDYSKFELLLLGGDLTWNTSAATSTLDYCDSIFDLGGPDTHLAAGNHDLSNVASLLSYTKKERYHCFSKNNITFIVLDTELNTPDISGAQLDVIKRVADTITSSDYLVLIQHRILWMANNPDLAQYTDFVAASSKNLGASNFFDEVYPELHMVKSKGIPVLCIAGDRTDINIEYYIEDSIQMLASGMVGTFPDSLNFAVLLTHFPAEHTMSYAFVPLSKLDTVSESTARGSGYLYRGDFDVNIYPNPCSDHISIQIDEPGHAAMKATLFSSTGSRLFEVDIPENKNTFPVNMSSLDSGLYYFRISSKDRTVTKKIIVLDTLPSK